MLIRAERQPLEQRPITSIRNGSVWICTGGARGITSYVAKELGIRFQLQLQLLGTAPEQIFPLLGGR